MNNISDEQLCRMLDNAKRDGTERAAAFVFVGSIPLAVIAGIFGFEVSSAANAFVSCVGYACVLCVIAGVTI